MPGAVDELGLGFALVGEAGTVVSACPRYAAMVGREPSAVVGLSLEDCTHPDDIASCRWLMKNARIHGDPYDVRKRYVRPDGSVLWVEQRVIVLRDAPGFTLLITVHPVNCGPGRSILGIESAHVGEYVADMSEQLSSMAAQASLPVTCDLLTVSARTARHEAGVA